MKKHSALIQSLVLLAFLSVFLLAGLCLPDRSFSPQENRALQTAPRFSFSDLFSGRFTDRFETYLTDQFPLRDQWIVLKARIELLLGKSSNNGVYLCDGDRLIEPYEAPASEELQANLDAVNALTETAGVPVYFALIPSAAELHGDLLPAGAPNDSELATISEAYAGVDARTVPIYEALNAHSGEALYYRTDHHWTTLGAYYGYTALAEAMGFRPVPLSDYTETTVTDQFCGTAWSSSGFHWVAPDSIQTYVTQGSAVITNYPKGTAVAGTLYDADYLAEKDKYSYFYGGNTPLLTVETGLTDAPSLLILRDSYMDSLSPYLFAHFSEIHIMDLRYYRASLKTYLAEHEIDNVLVCYSVKNFAEDDNLFLLAY